MVCHNQQPFFLTFNKFIKYPNQISTKKLGIISSTTKDSAIIFLDVKVILTSILLYQKNPSLIKIA
jgi:hypothetical protein